MKRRLLSLYRENEKLKLYAHAIEEINLQRPHVLSATEEALLAQASEVFDASSNTFGMLNNADLSFQPLQMKTEMKLKLHMVVIFNF